MEILFPKLPDLFSQLGLNSESSAINAFLDSHQLKRNDSIEMANFWNSSQSQFISEAKAEDAIWCRLVDELDALLHNQSMSKLTQ